MALTKKKKQVVIADHKIHGEDTGSADVQIALLTKRIGELASHLKDHPKDHHSRRGLLMIVGKRKRLLDYLLKSNAKRHSSLVKKLGLKK